MPNGGRYGDTGDELLDLVHWISSKDSYWQAFVKEAYTESIKKLIVKVYDLDGDKDGRLRKLLFVDYSPRSELSETQLMELDKELRGLLPPDQS